jgi:hypothetical protein
VGKQHSPGDKRLGKRINEALMESLLHLRHLAVLSGLLRAGYYKESMRLDTFAHGSGFMMLQDSSGPLTTFS